MKRYCIWLLSIILMLDPALICMASPPYISWEKRVIPNQYIKISYDGRDYWSLGSFGASNPNVRPTMINEAEIGVLLDKTSVFGYDGYDSEDEIIKTCYTCCFSSTIWAVY